MNLFRTIGTKSIKLQNVVRHIILFLDISQRIRVSLRLVGVRVISVVDVKLMLLSKTSRDWPAIAPSR